MTRRTASIVRNTSETSIKVEIDLDGRGQWDTRTGIRFLDHMISHVAKHGVFDIKVASNGPDQHHVVEDVAICLGQAFNKALGEKRGIVRMAHAVVPMDEALVLVAVDIGGRGYARIEATLGDKVEDLSSDLVRHFLESFAIEGRFNLHAKVLEGINDHHKVEALFKALGRALGAATRIDERLAGQIPSTKDVIEG
ncbi:MAG: Imidazoleglycerol-phosphate dehydratase [Dehalococcoidia bacterium]|nr:Imidazoleglycerol-phosphate dehydratase [Dehalococcoidia bacterium]